MIVSQGQRSLQPLSISADMSSWPLISKWLAGELLTRQANLPMNWRVEWLSQSKCDYVVNRDSWANLSRCRHPPGKLPNPADTRPFLPEKSSASTFLVPCTTCWRFCGRWGNAWPISAGAIWHLQCTLHCSSILQSSVCLFHIYSAPILPPPAPVHTS